MNKQNVSFIQQLNYQQAKFDKKRSMFLTKKNAGTIKVKSKNSKALGGWDDNDDANDQVGISSNANYAKFNQKPNQVNKINSKGQTNHFGNINLISNEAHTDNFYTNSKNNSAFNFAGFQHSYRQPQLQVAQSNKNTKKPSAQHYYSPQQLAELNNIDLQCKIVSTVLQPGGLRIKPNDVVLNEFFNEVKALDNAIIGSLLISYLYNPNASFQIKAKAIYTIQFLMKKNIQYSVYFKLHSQKIKQSPNSQDNAENYQKIKRGLLATLGAVVMRPEERKQQQIDLLIKQGINYIDPGYNTVGQTEGVLSLLSLSKKDSDRNQKQKPTKKLISPTQIKKQKKVLAGPKKQNPQIKKPNQKQVDLLGDNSYQLKNSNQYQIFGVENQSVKAKIVQNFDLLGEQKDQSVGNKQQLISFDQLMQKQKKKNKQSQLDFVF